MYIEKHIPNREKDEKLVLFLRRHWIILIIKWLVIIVIAFVPLALYLFLSYFEPEVLDNNIYYAFLFLLSSLYYLFTLLFFLNAFIDYYLDVWIVTDHRIINIEQRGLFNREIAEHTLERIQDVTAIQKGFWQTLFSYGDVHVQTAGEIQRFIFRQVNDPFNVVRIINEEIKKFQKNEEHELMEKIRPQNSME
ncbi:PH domain-containing protein [Candidatus Falkowbacteria bacterium]|nr:PH domain-containing protein [Candidatus Falkowbacteria bacterium]